MSKRADQMHVGMFFKNTGHHLAAWMHPGSQPDAGINVQHYVDCVQACEAASLDFIFFADGPAMRDDGSPEALSRTAQYIAYFEPITLLSALAMVTKHIGLVSTATTSYNEPYNVARKFASLDFISHGRAGWNVVTSGNPAAAYNFGREAHYAHDERYDRAQEFVQVVEGLWDSWEDDAFLYDRESRTFFNPDKVRKLNHKGEWFKVRGPLNIPRPPQGYPVIFQAGSSNDGRELAAATGEGIFNSETVIPRAKGYYDDVKGRMKRYGRDPNHMKIMPGCTAVVAATEKEAKEKHEYLQELIDPLVGREYIAKFLGFDISDLDLDDPVPTDRPSAKAEGGTFKNIMALVQEHHFTIRQLYKHFAGAHGKLTLVGSVNQVADTMQEWFHNYACDGFILQPSTMPGEMMDQVNLLIPELKNRGAIRDGYAGPTLRENMGLPRPENRYVVAARAKQASSAAE